MRKVVLFIAMSLDGYIADRQGGVDWLCGQDNTKETRDTYGTFIKDVDTVILGWNTYHQIVTELSPSEWVYDTLQSYVVTHRHMPEQEHIQFIQEDVCHLIRRLQKEQGKDIWICGGASIVQQLVAEDLIDRYYISVIPTLLGGGIRLFGETEQERKLVLQGMEENNGIVELIYKRK